MQEVFISYSSKEASKAYAIKDVLEKNNISCWMAPESIPDGSDYTHEIPIAIRNCKVFLVLISNISQTSIWVKNEVDAAVNSNKVVIPYMLEECELTDEFNFLLTGRQRVDAYHKKAEKLRRLVKRIQIELAAESDVDSVDMTINDNSKKKRKYSKAIVAVAISLLVLISLIALVVVYLARSELQKYEIESFYIIGETDHQYYDETFVFSGKSNAPIVNIYISNSNAKEEERFFLTSVESNDGNFRYETSGKTWWCKCNAFEIVPCDNNGEELLDLTKKKEIKINYREEYEPLKILGAPYHISRNEDFLISWKDIYADTNVIYHLLIVKAAAWERQSWNDSDVCFTEDNINLTGYVLPKYSLDPGKYVVVIWGSASGYTSSADYAYITVTE